MLSNGYSRDSSIFDGTGVGNLPSIGHIVFGDLNAFISIGPFIVATIVVSMEFVRKICCCGCLIAANPSGLSMLPPALFCVGTRAIKLEKSFAIVVADELWPSIACVFSVPDQTNVILH